MPSDSPVPARDEITRLEEPEADARGGPTPRAHIANTPRMLPRQFADRALGPPVALEIDGERWLARVAGEGTGGVGSYARAHIVSVFFFRADDPDTPRSEALLPSGRLEMLYPAELVALLRESLPFHDTG